MTFFIPPALLWAMIAFVGVGLCICILAFFAAARINREGED
jgi:hypothetical protein